MTAITPTEVAQAALPQVYKTAKQALALCESVDECKDWADRAAALASYAKQAADDQLEQKARAIRNRAIRRMGEVLAAIEPAKGGQPFQSTREATHPSRISRKSVADAAGISEWQRKQALRVAAVPDEDFDAFAHEERQPTLTELAERGTKKSVVIDHTEGRDPAVFNKCLHFVAALRDAARELNGKTDLLAHLTVREMAEAKAAASILRSIAEKVEDYP